MLPHLKAAELLWREHKLWEPFPKKPSSFQFHTDVIVLYTNVPNADWFTFEGGLFLQPYEAKLRRILESL